MAAFLADTELEGVVAELIPQPSQALSLGLGRDFAPLHAGGIDGEWTGLAPQELAYASVLEFAAKVPKRGIEARQGAHEVGTGEFVLALRNGRYQGFDVEGVGTHGPTGDLPVEDFGRDIRVVGRELAPADMAVVGRC